MLRRTTDRSGYCNEMRGQYQRRRHTGRHQGGGYHENKKFLSLVLRLFQSWSGVADKTDATLSKFSITLDPPSSVTVIGLTARTRRFASRLRFDPTLHQS
jgi:hypothetical protein